MGGLPPHPMPPSNFPTLAGCRAFQLNSDPVYLQIASDPTDLRWSPPPPTSDRHHSQVQVVSCLAVNQDSVNLLEQLIELKQAYSLDYRYLIKTCNSGTTSWKRCVGQDRGTELPCLLNPLSFASLSCSLTQNLSQPHPWGVL